MGSNIPCLTRSMVATNVYGVYAMWREAELIEDTGPFPLTELEE